MKEECLSPGLRMASGNVVVTPVAISSKLQQVCCLELLRSGAKEVGHLSFLQACEPAAKKNSLATKGQAP